MIPRRFFLYWSADKLSYLRYLCLKSIRHFHPDWQIDLFYRMPKAAKKTWKGDGKQDFHVYDGEDYLLRLRDLDINIIPIVDNSPYATLLDAAAPIHSSDIFRLQELHRSGGIYIDTDTLFSGPIDDLYNQFRNYDSVITYDLAQGFQIGFLAGVSGSKFFKDFLNQSCQGFKLVDYQSCGTDALYLLLSPGCDPHNSCNVLRSRCDRAYQEQYENAYVIPSPTLYPYDCGHIPDIFEGQGREVPKYCVHLFGGHPMFQEYNNIVTPDNIKEFNGFAFWLIREIGLV